MAMADSPEMRVPAPGAKTFISQTLAVSLDFVYKVVYNRGYFGRSPPSGCIRITKWGESSWKI